MYCTLNIDYKYMVSTYKVFLMYVPKYLFIWLTNYYLTIDLQPLHKPMI